MKKVHTCIFTQANVHAHPDDHVQYVFYRIYNIKSLHVLCPDSIFACPGVPGHLQFAIGMNLAFC